MKVKTVKGEEIILFEDESVEEMYQIIETTGNIFTMNYQTCNLTSKDNLYHKNQ